ncbi:SprT family zinc-dependent metalloprotease [Jeotgalicoccus sp. FSL K6-3177]|uniref:SprT family zinc-dependent metalloprotease n=1 Tax=Jeotgalicoccus sp. FSL K6-3177 TaxID=2921494 RepID=UPI0030FD85D2
MNSDELHSCARKFLAENFGLTLEIPIRISKRMKSKLGVFQIKYQKKQVVSKEIVMSHTFLVNNSREIILDVLYHECVHYALYTLKKPYRDSDREFTETLERLGIAKTRSYKYKGQAYLYECRKCSYEFTKRVKGYDKRYICRHCRGRFTYKGTVAAG